jgi:hypothetical protein
MSKFELEIKLRAMSHFEINKAVAEKLGLLVQEMQDSAWTGMTPSYHAQYPNTVWAAKTENGQQSEAWEQVCYTGSWSDAGPIIEKYQISLIKDISCDNWEAAEALEFIHGSIDSGNYKKNKSALVAAMLVFLDMEVV